MKDISIVKDRIAKRQERIQRLTANIEKLQKKLEKIEATQYDEERIKQMDIRWTRREIEEKQQKIDQLLKEIEKYKAEVAEYEAWKNKNRDVKVIWEFLERWKEHERRWYKTLQEHYVGGLDTVHEMEQEETRLWYEIEKIIGHYELSCLWGEQKKKAIEGNPKTRQLQEERKAIKAEIKGFYEMVAPVMMYLTDTNELNMAKLNRDLDYDALLMYDRFIDQIEHITGEITDVRGLDIGEKGELNGFVVGKEGKAKVQTIGAGGYNIQRFHYRTLVHEYK